MNELENNVLQHMGAVVAVNFKLAAPLSQLLLIREKISARGLKSFDKQDILDELGRLQRIAAELHGEMVEICDLLKRVEQ
ncbi:MAG: hypothetical protein WD824_15180 [Cyclobacteriaceae bacterium]